MDRKEDIHNEYLVVNQDSKAVDASDIWLTFLSGVYMGKGEKGKSDFAYFLTSSVRALFAASTMFLH